MSGARLGNGGLNAFEKYLGRKVNGLRASHRIARVRQPLIAQKLRRAGLAKIVNLSNGVAQGSANETLRKQSQTKLMCGQKCTNAIPAFSAPTPTLAHTFLRVSGRAAARCSTHEL